MMLTIPLVIYGVARYLYLIYEKQEGESPERVLLSDKPLLFTVSLWGISALLMIYLLPLVS
jgi:choline-glycine betaine transporter